MIEELLIALSGSPGDIFYPSPTSGPHLSRQDWMIAPELIECLHPGEQTLLSKLLELSSFVAGFEDFVQKYNSLSLFRQVIESTEKLSEEPTSRNKEIRFAGDNDLPLFGTYASCLSDGFSSIIEKYRSRLIDLEAELCDHTDSDGHVHPSNSLQRVYSELQSYFRIFPVLDKLRATFAGQNHLRNGGEILSFIYCMCESERADEVVKSELDTLLRRCMIPFRNHLLQWLSTGRLESDRFGEFFIQATNDESSSGSFVITKAYLPSFVNEALAEKILFIGKSVVMILESSSSGQPDFEEWTAYLKPLSTLLRFYSTDDGNSGVVQSDYDDVASQLDKEIEIVRRAAAEKLYSRCFEGTKAMDVLEAWVKNAFFIGKGELFLALIDAAGSALSGVISADQLDAKTRQLTAYWSNALEKIYWQNDEEREYFEKVAPQFQFDQANAEDGWSAVHLQLYCPPRLSPIFTAGFVTDLNVVFRFLLRWRRTLSLIESCWLHLKKSPASVVHSLPSLDKIHQLTSLMLFVVKNLQYYIQADVLEVVYAQTAKELSSTRDFEQVLKLLHNTMLDQIFAYCFLKRGTAGHDEWQSKMGKILKLFGDECDAFSNLVLARLRYAETADSDIMRTPENDRVFAAQVHECYVNFQRKMALLFKILTTSKDNSACLSRLLLRLDFNDYFSRTQMFSI